MSQFNRRASAADAVGAAARYQALDAARRPFLERAREAAKLTTPSLLPPEGHSGFSTLSTPFQGVGARGVNTLANKLLLAQFPPNTPFFRLKVAETALSETAASETAPSEKAPSEKAPSEKALSMMPLLAPSAAGAEQEDASDLDEEHAADGAAQAIERALARIERAAFAAMETGFLRAALHAALRQLIVAGNCLLHLNPEGGARIFRLDRYVVKRDPMGGVREIVVKEAVAPDALPEEFLAETGARGTAGGADRTVDLYTWVRRERDHWSVVQEARGQEVPGSRGAYPLDRLDWLALRWSHVDGEDYGRGHVEEYLGDLRSLEGLMQAIVEGSAAAARMTVLVAPNGQTDAEELAEAENGAIIDGEGKDVSIVQANKFNDFRVAFEAIKMLTERLSFAFLLNSAAKRDAQYVTAEEVRFMAGELEDALGGVYSVLAEELQKPLVELLLHHQAREGRLPPLPDGVVRPEIVTGLDALGRGRELQKLETFVGFVAQISRLSATPLAQRLDLPRMLVQGAAAIGVAAEDLIRPAAAENDPAAALQSGIAAGAQLSGTEGEGSLAQLIEQLGPILEQTAAAVSEPA